MTVLLEPLLFDRSAGNGGSVGTVTLVGAGPGDPELLTLKAARLLESAQLVLYDHLVGKAVLALVPRSADLIYVGKESGHHTLPQAQIGALMVRLARSGRSLLRLKGGDPYIFGRGGEEVQVLAAHGIPFDVVPGISAAQAASALAGIPLTHRDHAQSVVFTTGHLRDAGDADGGEPDWALLARPRQTIVIYMGVATLARSCRALIAHGLPATTPAAVIERAATPLMRTLTATLDTLPSLALAAAVRAPALIVVGEVVGLHGQLRCTTATAGAADGPA